MVLLQPETAIQKWVERFFFVHSKRVHKHINNFGFTEGRFFYLKVWLSTTAAAAATAATALIAAATTITTTTTTAATATKKQ
jgi:hypothetical protein